MLGQKGTSTYKLVEDFKSHKDYLEYMYRETKGFVTRSVITQKTYQETFSYADKLINKNSYYNMVNVYTSMNTFMSRKRTDNCKSGRKVENIKKLNALYLDIDCYKIGLTQNQVLYELEQEYFGKKIPVPTFVINSGRGLYLIWKIEEDRNALPRWKACQKYLFEQCKELNADPQAIDAARILRVPFTINSKNNEKVSIMLFNDIKYTLYEIIKEYDIEIKNNKSAKKHPYGEATEKQRTIANWQATTFKIEPPNFKSYDETFKFIEKYSQISTLNDEKKDKVTIINKVKTIKNVLNGRIKDLFKLFSMRKGEDCNREYALFLCRLWCAEKSNDFDFALKQTLFLNKSFDVPFDEKYVEVRTKSAETKIKNRETYNYGKKALIRVLGITEEEQKELAYICLINKDEKACRVKNNRRAYLARLEKEGKEIKKESICIRRKKIAELLMQGKDKDEICFDLKISKRTFDRDKAVIKSNGLLELNKDILEENENEQIDIERVKQEKNIKINENVFEKKHLKTNAKIRMTLSPFFKYINYTRTPKGCSALLFLYVLCVCVVHLPP